MRALFALFTAALLAGCAMAPTPPGVDALLPVDALLLGEQHDAAAHQQRHLETVRSLAQRRRLAALALEMAERGTSTAGLPTEAGEEQVRTALRWNEKGWPWRAYGPSVMAAVRAGVPVVGASLPQAQMRAAMADDSLDGLLDAPGLQAQQTAIREGHCGLLPERQIAPMARVQIARDRAMAQAVAAVVQPGKTVVLLAGGGHVDEALGVPRHLAASVSTRSLRWPEQPAQKDYCEQMRGQMREPARPDSTP